MPYRDRFPQCPRCHLALDELELITKHRVLSCSACNGIWMTSSVFREIAITLVRNSQPPRIRPRADTAPLLACPLCDRDMEKVSVTGRPKVLEMLPVPVDRCVEHGAWFDPGELQKVLSALAKNRQE